MWGQNGIVTLKRFARAGLWSLVGLAAASLSAANAWSQDPSTGTGATVRTPGMVESAGSNSGRLSRDERATLEKIGKESQSQSEKEIIETDMALQDAREQIELLEVQVAAKQAKVRVAEAQLKQAQDSLNLAQRQSTRGVADDEKLTIARNDVAIKQAQLDAERAELRDPELRLKWAKRQGQELERQAGLRNDPSGTGSMDMGLMHMAHMAQMGVSPEWMSIMEIHRKLELLRGAVMRLEDEMDGILGTTNTNASAATNPSTKK